MKACIIRDQSNLGWRASRDGPSRTARSPRITGMRRRVRGVRWSGMTITASEASRKAIGRPGKTQNRQREHEMSSRGQRGQKDARGSEWNKAGGSMKDAPVRGPRIALSRFETIRQESGGTLARAFKSVQGYIPGIARVRLKTSEPGGLCRPSGPLFEQITSRSAAKQQGGCSCGRQCAVRGPPV
jgi:hypothetical protein